MDTPTDYPTSWETHAVLKDGSTVQLRPIQAGDRDALERFHGRQSKESIYFRFFRYRPELSDRELDYFTQVDYRDRMAFVALLGDELVAVARYEKWDDRPEAEVAFFVDDAHHGKGLATLMLEFLAAAGRDRGLSGFTATVLAENYRMLAVFRSAGFDVSTRFADGHIEVELGIDVTEETSSAIADRQRKSAARSVARIIEPATVAVIGASRKPGTVGHELVRNLSQAVEAGGGNPAARVFPVNPSADEILGLSVTPDIAAATEAVRRSRTVTITAEDIQPPREAAPAGAKDANTDPQAIDLAVVAVRAELVEDVVQQCADAGVRGLLVVSAGFSELGSADREREQRLVKLARANGMRMIGPNAFGVINTKPEVELGAVFHPIPVRPGAVALASESGPLGAAVLERIRAAGAGVSSFVGIGNRADVSVNDLLDYWGLDDATDVVMLYVENYGNLRNFSTVARRVSENKPVITIQPSSPELTELMRQSGVILVDEVSQLAEQALMAGTQPVARGNRVVIVSNTASLARLAASACRRHGLEVVVPGSVANLASHDSVLIGNLDTVSLMPSSDPGDYERFMVAAAVSDEVDVILMAVAPTAYLTPERLVSLLDRVNRSVDKPIAATGLVNAENLRVPDLPTFTFPEEAAQVLGRHARYGTWRAARDDVSVATAEGGDTSQSPARPGDAVGGSEGGRPTPAERIEPAVVNELLGDNDEVHHRMLSADLPRLLEAFELPIAPYVLAHDADEVSAAADALGFPLAIKAGDLVRRSIGESGGAAIDLHDRQDLLATYRRMSEQLGPAMNVAVVQRMVASTGMVRLELAQDPSFGALIAIGHGGSAFNDAEATARRFLPMDDLLVDELIDAAVDHDLLPAVNPAERSAMAALIHRLAAAASLSSQLASVVLRPVLVSDHTVIPVDVEITLRRSRPDLLAGLRHI